MKKYILLIIIIIFSLTGCVYVNNSSIDAIVDNIISSDSIRQNHASKGYKLYIPKGLKSEKVDEYNEVIRSEVADYYLYVDLVNYFNKIELDYIPNESIYYSKQIMNGDQLSGLINIVKKQDDYIVLIVYNYASVEVKTTKNHLNSVIANSLIMLKSISYNDEIIKSLLTDNVLVGDETIIEIFDRKIEDLNTLDYDDTYSGEDEYIYDPDEIN